MKTLRELNVKPGDVVRWKNVNEYTIESVTDDGIYAVGHLRINTSSASWTIVSRAEPHYPSWGKMTDVEKGALLLAHQEGKVIETSPDGDDWREIEEPLWVGVRRYRIRPEPVVKTYEGSCWAYHYVGQDPTTASSNVGYPCVEGTWIATHIDGKLNTFTWKANS